MAKKISLELEIGGVKKSVSNINELEAAISEANKELKGLDIGSEAFNKLSGQIKKAKDTAEDLQESLKGQDLEKRVGAYAKVGSAIVSSFAAAQSALALFGTESEDVARAAAQAQAVLTIALTAREVAEGAVAIKTVAANIATVASAAAANTANVATKALYATLAANPYGAILAVVGLVVGALVAFTGESEKQVDVLKEVNAAVSEEAVNFNRQIILLQSLNTSNALRTKTIKDLNKEYPGFNAFLDENNRLTKEGIRFADLRTKQLIEEAKIKILVNKIAEQSVKLLEIEQENIIDNITIWDELWASIRGVGRLTPTSALTLALEEQRERSNEAKKVLDQLQNTLNQVTLEYGKTLDQIGPYTQALENQNQQEIKAEQNKKNVADKQRELNEAYKKGLTDVISFKNELEKLNNSFKKYDETVKNLEKIEIDPKIVDDLKKVQQARIEGAKQLQTASENLAKSVKDLTTIPTDTFFENFAKYRSDLERAFSTGNVAKFKEIYDTATKDIVGLTNEQRQALFALYETYQDVGTLIQTTPGFNIAIENLKKLQAQWNEGLVDREPYEGPWGQLLSLMGDLAAATGDFKIEISEAGELLDLKFDPAKVKQNATEVYNIIRQSLVTPITTDLLEQRQRAIEASLKSLEGTALQTARGQLEKVKIALKEFKDTGVLDVKILDPKEVEQAVNSIIQSFDKLVIGGTKAEQQVIAINKQVSLLTQTLSANTEALGASLTNLLIANVGVLSEKLMGLRNKEQRVQESFIAKAKKDTQGFETFKNGLVEQGILTREQLETMGYEQQIKLFAAYLKSISDLQKESDDERLSKSTETLKKISEYLQTFSQGLNQAASLANESIQVQLEFLEKSYKSQLEKVVGDTESANKKRAELEEEYQEQKKEIEKRGRLTSLKFSLAQAISNAALAITNIWATSGINPILAGIQTAIVAGITTAEIAIINEQINMANMFRRGGLTKAQGGMLLSGPSHENGGIPLAQMGVIAEGQEAIINRNSLINFRDLLSTINQAGGGRPLVVNNFDDTRIVEAIAQQKQKPLKAYVLQSEITNEQALARRLDDLSKI